jgi:hypothetical protein
MLINVNFFREIDSNHVSLPAYKSMVLLVNSAAKITNHLSNLLAIQYSDILGVTHDQANFSINNRYLS